MGCKGEGASPRSLAGPRDDMVGGVGLELRWSAL